MRLRVRNYCAAGCLLLLSSSGCTDALKQQPSAEQIRALRANLPKPDETPQGVAVLTPFREWGVKETVADALARIGEAAVPALIDLLSDPDPEVRLQATRAIARMGTKGQEAVPALISALDDPDKLVRQGAARALGQMGPAAEEAIPALIETLKNPETRSMSDTLEHPHEPPRSSDSSDEPKDD